MEPAAASYLVEQQYVTNSEGYFQEGVNDKILVSKLHDELRGDFPIGDDVHRLSVEGYFVSELPPEDQPYHSSFFSAWYSYQSITPDPVASSLLHQELEFFSSLTARPTSTSTAAAAKRTEIALCAAAGVLIGFAGVLA